MARFSLSLARSSPWLRLLHVVVLAVFCVFYWSCCWAIIGLVLASFVTVLLLLPVLFWPTVFLPWNTWYVTELPLWLVGGGFAAGGVLGFVQNVRIVLGEVRRTLFFAEVKEMAERIVEETTEEQAGSDHGVSATPSSPKTMESIRSAEMGLVERPA